MLAIFGAAEAGGLESLITFLGVLLAIYIFIKFCSWAKSFQLSGGIKKVMYLLTGVGLIVFNVLYAKGNAMLSQGDSSMATIALAGSLVWVLIFAFALMAETKSE